jgi:hypothetical protein
VTPESLVADAAALVAHDALAPVRAALLAQATREAAALRAAADEDARAVLAAARAQAEQIRAAARDAGEHDAERVRTEQRTRARRRARGVVLSARRQALDELTRQAAAAVRALWDEPASRASLRAALLARARTDLGSAAQVGDHPAGGIVATTPGRRAVLRLDDLARQAVVALGPRLDRLWSP